MISSILAEKLNEFIFPKPSNLLKENRFINSDVAGCSGKCASGHCIGITDSKSDNFFHANLPSRS